MAHSRRAGGAMVGRVLTVASRDPRLATLYPRPSNSGLILA
jgi:hypothetical protein